MIFFSSTKLQSNTSIGRSRHNYNIKSEAQYVRLLPKLRGQTVEMVLKISQINGFSGKMPKNHLNEGVMDQTDKKLLQLLKQNARASIISLAQSVGLSRSTTQDRIKRLEQKGIIAGYTINLNETYEKHQIVAHVMISVHPKKAPIVVMGLRKMINVQTLHAIAGEYDLIAILSAETTEEVDKTIDEMGKFEGIEKTRSSIVLSTKFQR
jgi:DNA-binding Lrp family transcriptional regulator